MSLTIVRNLLIEAGKVKFILDIIFVNLAKELIAPQSDKPRYPRYFLGATHLSGINIEKNHNTGTNQDDLKLTREISFQI